MVLLCVFMGGGGSCDYVCVLFCFLVSSTCCLCWWLMPFVCLFVLCLLLLLLFVDCFFCFVLGVFLSLYYLLTHIYFFRSA